MREEGIPACLQRWLEGSDLLQEYVHLNLLFLREKHRWILEMKASEETEIEGRGAHLDGLSLSGQENWVNEGLERSVPTGSNGMTWQEKVKGNEK